MKRIDLRSDTVTKPTEAMRKAMAAAEVGDDVYCEDPTVTKLEELAADRFGKQAGLFVPSGTMGNQLALLTHTNRSEEIIVEAEAHVYFYEVGGIGALAGVQTRTIRGDKGVLKADKVREAVRMVDIHCPRTSLICIENTHNRAGGTVTGLADLEALGQVAKEHNIPIHCDGARIFNAATHLNLNVKDLTKDIDTIMFCLSKGLGAPIGSLLVGPKDWITKARRWRKMLGGGMRQVGVIAAAGIVALEEMVERLQEDHLNAQVLAHGLANIPGLKIDLQSVQTNIVLCDVSALGVSAHVILDRLAERGVYASAFADQLIRFVTHKDVSSNDINAALLACQEAAKEFCVV